MITAPVAQLDRALVYGTKGQMRPKLNICQPAPLAQLDRALVYGTKGWGFELLRVRQKRLKSVDFDRFFYVFMPFYELERPFSKLF